MKVLALALLFSKCASSEARYYSSSGLAVEKFDGFFNDDLSFFNGKTGEDKGYERFFGGSYISLDAEDNYSLTFKGYFEASTSTFDATMRSDDASYLWIGNKDQGVESLEASISIGSATINNGGVHGTEVAKSASLTLVDGPGYYPIIIIYGESGGGEALSLEGNYGGFMVQDYNFVPPYGTCFHGASLVSLEGDMAKPMTELQVGDKILTATADGTTFSFEAITELPHKAGNSEMGTFLELKTDSGKAVRMTGGHFIPKCNGELEPAAEIVVGDCLFTVDGKETVTEITSATKFGIYTAITKNKFIVVDGIVASPYSLANDVGLIHNNTTKQ